MKIDKMQKAESVREVHLEEVPVVQGDWWAQHASYTEFRRQGMKSYVSSLLFLTPEPTNPMGLPAVVTPLLHHSYRIGVAYI